MSLPCECRPAQAAITVTAADQPTVGPIRFTVVMDKKCPPAPLRVVVGSDSDTVEDAVVSVALYDRAAMACDSLFPPRGDGVHRPPPDQTVKSSLGQAASFFGLGLEWGRPREFSVLAVVEAEAGILGWACDDESVSLECNRSMTLVLPFEPAAEH